MTRRDEEILTALCSQVRFFSLEQIAREWWPDRLDQTRLARKRMLRLNRDGWLNSVRLLARPLLELAQPVLKWSPLNCTPDYPAISRTLRGRWKLPARVTEVFLGSAKARDIFGGAVPDAVRNLCQTTHDLHVAEIFLHYRRLLGCTKSWVGEDEITASGHEGAVPDAYLRNDEGGIRQVIEFGGAYSATRVSEFHAYCSTNSLAYEMW